MAQQNHRFFSNIGEATPEVIADYVKHMSPQEYINALSGNYENYHPTDYKRGGDDSRHFIESRNNNEKNNSKVVDNIIQSLDDNDRYGTRNHLAHMANHNISENDFKKITDKLEGHTDRSVIRSPHMKGNILSDYIDKHKDNASNLGEILRDSPNLQQRHVHSLLNNPNTTTKNAINTIIEHHLDKIDPKYLSEITNNPQFANRLSPESLDKIMEKMTPENRKRFINDKLGISEGNIYNEDDENWDNWSKGDNYSATIADNLASSKMLDPSQIDHIKRHGSGDQKLNLFKNPHTPAEVAAEMHDKYLNDDNHHGYDLDKLKEDIGKYLDYSKIYEDHGDDIREKAEEEYPFSEYIDDNYNNESDIMGEDRDDWIDNYLDDHYDWTHKNPENPDEEEDLGGRYKSDHPEYESRQKEADDAFDEALKQKKQNLSNDDHIYDSYRDSLSDRESELASEKMDEIKDDIHNDKEYYPAHLQDTLPHLTNAAKSKVERERMKNWSDADKETQNNKSYLSDFMPNGFDTKYQHGEGQHHLEMAKKYADANGGAIDIGTLNKKHPNLVNQWKNVFSGGKGKLKSEEIQQKIDELPKNEYNLSYVPWKANNMQNINKQNQVVVRLDHSPESIKQLEADPAAYNVFKKINEVSQRSGHPTNYNTIGWARVDMSNPKHWMVDEVQRDHDSAARNYLKENGKPEDAEALSRVMALHKNWREQLFNAVQKLAEKNGVEKISTHSGESKAAHTGASKVHSVYNESYEKVPKQMGFKPDSAENLPLSEEGRATFAKQRNTSSEKVDKHKDAMRYHANMWNAHYDLSSQPELGEDPSRSDIHAKLSEEHDKKYREHRRAAQNIDPTDIEVKSWITPGRYLDENPLSATNAVMEAHSMNAKNSAANVVDTPEAITEGAKHVNDHLLENVKIEEPYTGHTLDLRPEAFKKNIFELFNLMKAEGFDDSNMKIIQAVQFMEENKEALEQLKQANPDAYKAIQAIMDSLTEVFKQSRGESIQAISQQLQLQDELHSQMGQDSPDESPEAQEMNFAGRAKQDEKPHNHRTTYTEGQIRDHADGQRREKEPDGTWKNISSGLAKPKGGQ